MVFSVFLLGLSAEKPGCSVKSTVLGTIRLGIPVNSVVKSWTPYFILGIVKDFIFG